ncbi:MAG: SIR2 family protein [Acidobacteriota bacterium]|nr:SIR2 family protein [Acidobacteriota bacterium]
MTTQLFTEKDRFEIGGERVIAFTEATADTRGADAVPAPKKSESESLDDLCVRIGTLLKTENVSFLLGAGASVNCGGLLIGSVPLPIERQLHDEGIRGTDQPRIRQWLKIFYLAVRVSGGGEEAPISREQIIMRQTALTGGGGEPLRTNFERVLAILFRWRSALPKSGGRLKIDGSLSVDAKSDDIDDAIKHASLALANNCNLPTNDKEDRLADHKTLLRKLLTRPLNLKRTNIFTLNYDTLVEQAADAEGVVLLDGFVGTQRRVFRPESYEQDLYFPAETTEGRVHRFDRVLHLYKLHGSITWTANEPTMDDPYGVQTVPFKSDGVQPLLIYPAPTKYGETLGMPYSELFRRFSGVVTRPQSVLFVIGYGFGDEHVNAIVRQALAVPSFTLVIVDPNPQSEFLTRLRTQKDRRVWIAEGPMLGTLAGFVEHVLPDLRDEQIRKKVLATYRSLARNAVSEESQTDED